MRRLRSSLAALVALAAVLVLGAAPAAANSRAHPATVVVLHKHQVGDFWPSPVFGPLTSSDVSTDPGPNLGDVGDCPPQVDVSWTYWILVRGEGSSIGFPDRSAVEVSTGTPGGFQHALAVLELRKGKAPVVIGCDGFNDHSVHWTTRSGSTYLVEIAGTHPIASDISIQPDIKVQDIQGPRFALTAGTLAPEPGDRASFTVHDLVDRGSGIEFVKSYPVTWSVVLPARGRRYPRVVVPVRAGFDGSDPRGTFTWPRANRVPPSGRTAIVIATAIDTANNASHATWSVVLRDRTPPDASAVLRALSGRRLRISAACSELSHVTLTVRNGATGAVLGRPHVIKGRRQHASLTVPLPSFAAWLVDISCKDLSGNIGTGLAAIVE